MLTPIWRERLIGIMVAARGWDSGGCRTALEATDDQHHIGRLSTWVRVVGAYIDAEDDFGRPKFRTPGLLHAPGPHWDGTPMAEAKQPSPCPEHPTTPYLRCDCRRREREHAVPAPPDLKARIRAEAEAARHQRETDRQEAIS